MLREHESRREVVAEMHLRRWPIVSVPSTVFQIVFAVQPEDRAIERDRIAALPAGSLEEDSNPRHVAGTLPGGTRFAWERHNEASTMTLFVDAENQAIAMLDEQGEGSPLAHDLGWAMDMPGSVVRATRIVVVKDEKAASRMLDQCAFEPMDVVSCYVGCAETRKAARIWSDFRLHEHGFGYVLVAANGMQGADLSRTIQRMQELGNYRNLALLGLPVARRGWKVLDAIESQLGELTGDVANDDVTDDALLEEVTRMSIELATEATTADYRMSATEAYAKIVEERLDDLCVQPCDNYLSLVDFTRRRLQPAVRTCAAHRRRSEQLSQRTAQFVSLFRTRIETRIENQNARLLASMEASAARQLRLQQLVEGFSVVALTYYSISLIAHILEGLEEGMGGIHPGPILAVLTPVVAVLIWLIVHRAKALILK